ncbi:MAG: aminoglycoside phosphotransferase family protein [Chloroflexota bacterium]|nr:aminoglycoside phosphotransferase family protein [Chloroflexota bacterium]
MSETSHNLELSILELPAIVTHLFERAQRPLLSGASDPLGLFVRYLRRKPGRGLAVIYSIGEPGTPVALRKVQAGDPHRAVSLALAESALEGAHIRFTTSQAQEAPLAVQPTGVVQVETLGISVQAFPADNGLPALAASCDTAHNGPLFPALEAAAQTFLHNQEWRLVDASAEPVRYKPASRCVIRYRLTLEHATGGTPTRRKLTLFGKVYAEPEQARAIQATMQRIYTEQTQAGMSTLPRPLGTVEALGLTINEAIQPPELEEGAGTQAVLRTGLRALQPRLVQGRGGEITGIVTPDEELRLTAVALARLHTSAVRSEGAPRTGAKEAKRARERAALIAAHNPAQAAEVQRLAQQLAERLKHTQPDAYRPAHGGFKASQLLFHSQHVFIVDFDGFCLADPALDVGYFLAYLRPSGLWYQRAGMRQWFEAAASIFITTYRQAMLERGIDPAIVDGILQRTRLYEAALLFKIATRRANRLNSPRPKELSAMLTEIAVCLSNDVRRE